MSAVDIPFNAAPVAVLRPAPTGFGPALAAWSQQHLVPLAFRIARTAWPIPRFGTTVVATRYDDVREVFLNDSVFGVPWREKLDVIMGGEPFFLGMPDSEEYRRQTDALRKVMVKDDIPKLKAEAEALADRIVAESGGRLEVVDDLARRVTYEVLCRYFGVTDPPEGDIRVWTTRLFEFQFADRSNDPTLRAEVDRIAPALRNHFDSLIAERRASGAFGDDVLGRCLAEQSRNPDDPQYKDVAIRTALMGIAVGGPPQPPMVVPQALEQLLRRPEALAGAQKAAADGDDALLAGYVFEAMRFDPLAPALPRIALKDCILAAGTSRATKIPAGSTVLAAFGSAMLDHRRVPDPYHFNPRRQPYEYIHFGHGLHTCFGIRINEAVLPVMLKALLKRPRLRHAKGGAGRLIKRGAFAYRLEVEFD